MQVLSDAGIWDDAWHFVPRSFNMAMAVNLEILFAQCKQAQIGPLLLTLAQTEAPSTHA